MLRQNIAFFILTFFPFFCPNVCFLFLKNRRQLFQNWFHQELEKAEGDSKKKKKKKENSDKQIRTQDEFFCQIQKKEYLIYL